MVDRYIVRPKQHLGPEMPGPANPLIEDLVMQQVVDDLESKAISADAIDISQLRA